jgi:hypothetical protein
MKRHSAISLLLMMILASAVLSPADASRPIGPGQARDGDLRVTYALDSLYIHGSGGNADQLITPRESITVVAWLADTGGAWHASSPVDEFILIPNTDSPPTVLGADTENFHTYGGSNVSGISISESSRRLTFTVLAPASWGAGVESFTLYLDGKCTGLHQAQVSETYIGAAGVTLLHDGEDPLAAGFSYGLTASDTTPPTFVLAGCYATSLTTIRLEFSEAVSESGGDAGQAFEVTGDGIVGTILGSNLTSTSSTVWTLTLASALPDRDWQGTITYDRDNIAAMLVDGANNEVADGHAVTPNTERIPPANPTMSAPANTADLSGGSIAWAGTGESSAVDPSIASVALQGSLNGTAWTTLNTDSNVGDAAYSGTWAIGTQYNYYRLLATDDQGNIAASGASTNFQEKQRIVLSGTVSQELGTYEDQITVSLTDAYGNLESGTHTLSLTKTSGAGTVTFRETPAGSNITTLDIVSASSATFYMAADAVGVHEIRAATAGLLADTLSCTITTGAASRLLVRLPGQSFTSGVGISGTPTQWTAGGGIEFRLYIVDDSDNLVEETGTRTLDFASTAINSPRNFAPRIDGVPASGWEGRSIDFTSGVSEVISANFYETGGGTITASDDDGSPALTGVTSSLQTIKPAQADFLVFSLDNGTVESNTAWTGVNTVTVADFYGNTQTSFDAAVNAVTVTTSGGTLEIDSRGDAVLDQTADFASGVADLTALGTVLTATSGTYTISGTIAGVVMDWPNTTDTKTISVNAPTLSNASPAWLSRIDAKASSPGYMLQANVDENGESLTVYWAFDDDSTKYSGYAVSDSATVVTSGGLIQRYLSGAAVHALGDGYDYMFWWVGGSDAQGNPPDGKPISSNRLVYLVNPTLTVTGVDVAAGFEPNSTNNPITGIQLQAEQPGATIVVSRVSFTKTSTSNATTTHISGFKLWHDTNGNGVWDNGVDTQLGSVTGTVNPTFTGLSVGTTNGTTTHLLLTVDVSAAASQSQTLGMELVGADAFTLQNSVDDLVPAGDSWPQPANAPDYTLPVEFGAFSAATEPGINRLSWRTESEINSLGFRIWRAEATGTGVRPALDAFQPVADWRSHPELLGQENTTAATDYRWEDHSIEAGQTYWYRLEAVDLDGSAEFHSLDLFVHSLAPPADYAIEGNWPNPFNPSTTIRFVLPAAVPVELAVYNLQGQKVRSLLSGTMLNWGRHEIFWDGANEAGVQVASGTYIYRLHTPDFSQARKMVMLK